MRGIGYELRIQRAKDGKVLTVTKPRVGFGLPPLGMIRGVLSWWGSPPTRCLDLAKLRYLSRLPVARVTGLSLCRSKRA